MPAASNALRTAFRIEWRSITPVKGVVTAVPVVGVFAAALAFGTTSIAIAMAIGANLVAIVSLVGAPKLSLRLALTDAIGLGVSVVVGAGTASSPLLHDTLLLPWCFVAGLAVLFGLTQGIIGSQIVVAYIVLGRQPATWAHACSQGALVALGASIEILALLTLRLPASLRYQRSVLATALESVADYAQASPDQSALAALAAIDEAQRVLAPSSLFGRSDARDLRGIVDQVRRSRLELTAIAGLRGRLVDRAQASTSVALEDVLHAYATALRSIAAEIRHPIATPVDPPQNMRLRLDVASQLLALETDETVAVVARQCLTHLESLRGQLRSCRDLARREQDQGNGRAVERAEAARVSWSDQVALVRSHLHRDDVAFRHAIRYAIAVVASSVLASFWHLPRGYWVPFSVAVILKPDYSTLLRRGVSRVVGTALGATLAAVLVSELHPSGLETTVLVFLVASAAYATWSASFAVSIGLVSSLVLIMLSTAVHDSLGTASDRFVDVTLGAAIAASTYLLWPSSQDSGVADAQRALRQACSTYIDAVFGQILDGAHSGVATASRAAHVAYSRAEGSVGRSLDEPAPTRGDDTQSRTALVASLRLMRALHSLRLGTVPSSLSAHRDQLQDLKSALIDALTDGNDNNTVQERFIALEQAWRDDPRANAFLLTLDEITNAVDTLWGVRAPSDH